MAKHTPAKQLYDMLVSRDFDPELLDSSGRPSQDPSETEIFSFDFQTGSGNDYGTIVIMLGTENDLEVYFGDNIGKGMEATDKKEWFDFLYQLRMFSKRNLLSFDLKNLNRLRYSMQGQAAIKEGLFESWTGTRTTSWNGRQTEARLMIKHKRPLGETDARFRYVESLFVETAEGERYKLPFTKLSGGRAMVEHVRNGGRPYDTRGQHISEMVNELSVLSRFRRANHGKIFEGDTAALVEQTNAYYETAQHTLKSLSTHSGYAKYFESWNPNDISEQEVVIEGLKHLFVTQTLDQRIEEALPLLARIQQQGNAMKEANIFETWANTLVEGTWSTPDTPEKRAQLVELMSQEFPVGADATNSTEQLYDLIGDDVLFDQLQALAESDPNADCRQVIYERMQELAENPDIAAAMSEFTMDTNAPAEPTDPAMNAEEPVQEIKDPATQTEDPAGTKQPAYPEYQEDLAAILKAAGVDDTVVAAPNYEEGTIVKESVLNDSTGSTFEHILNTYKRDVKDFEETDELSDDLYQALFDYYFDDIPYGTKKARTGDPHEWVADRFAADLGIEGAGFNSPGIGPEDDPHLERESVMHGDYAEEVRAPHSVDGGMDNPLIQDDTTELFNDKLCNMSEAGQSCPVHGVEECWGSESSPLAGQYGHSGKMKEVGKETSFLDRLKELSGMIRN
jgi:hypothetical protein